MPKLENDCCMSRTEPAMVVSDPVRASLLASKCLTEVFRSLRSSSSA